MTRPTPHTTEPAIPEQSAPADKSASPQMFNRIAGRYDFLNRLLSMRRDVAWRRRVARYLPDRRPLHVLDLATGTGDQLLSIWRAGVHFDRGAGFDLAEEMLARGRDKVLNGPGELPVSFRTGDACDIPSADAEWDAVTMSFGIRNVPDVSRALAEMVRVLRPGGRVVILEFSLPRVALIRGPYLWYFRNVLPRLGGWISGDAAAYRYLNQTVEEFPYGRAFLDVMEQQGLADAFAVPLTFGIASIYVGTKPEGNAS